MKNLQRKSALSLALLTIALGASFATTPVLGQSEEGLSKRERIMHAMRRGGIREALKVEPHLVQSIETSSCILHNVESLVKFSSDVVVCTPVSNACRLADDGRLIFTDFRVRVEEAFREPERRDKEITISLPGGRVEFEDGTSAESIPEDMLPLEEGKKYVLFLVDSPERVGGYLVKAGSQGMFVVENGRVRSLGRPIDTVFQQIQGMDRNQFAGDVRAAVAKWPKPQGCCGE